MLTSASQWRPLARVAAPFTIFTLCLIFVGCNNRTGNKTIENNKGPVVESPIVQPGGTLKFSFASDEEQRRAEQLQQQVQMQNQQIQTLIEVSKQQQDVINRLTQGTAQSAPVTPPTSYRSAPQGTGGKEIRTENGQILFRRGSVSATVRGVVGSNGNVTPHWLRAFTGQRMSVYVNSRQVGFNILIRGRVIGTSDASGHWSGALPESGDYTIQAFPRDQFDQRYQLTVSISPL